MHFHQRLFEYTSNCPPTIERYYPKRLFMVKLHKTNNFSHPRRSYNHATVSTQHSICCSYLKSWWVNIMAVSILPVDLHLKNEMMSFYTRIIYYKIYPFTHKTNNKLTIFLCNIVEILQIQKEKKHCYKYKFLH